jgi:hypothetical protein
MLPRMFCEAHPDTPRPVAVDISRYISLDLLSARTWLTPLLKTRWLVSPSPLHTPTPDIRAGQRPTESDQHCGEGQNLPAHSRRTSTPPTR